MFNSLDKKTKRLLFKLAVGMTGTLMGLLIITSLKPDPPVDRDYLQVVTRFFITATVVVSTLIYVRDAIKGRK